VSNHRNGQNSQEAVKKTESRKQKTKKNTQKIVFGRKKVD